MPLEIKEEYLKALRKAYHANNLTLYLGAGVSAGNGLPSWDKLVLAMYFSAIDRDEVVKGLSPFPNYLFAIAEWHLERRNEPLDITSRKIRLLLEDENRFWGKLHKTLYTVFTTDGCPAVQLPTQELLLQKNATLKAVTNLCAEKNANGTLVRSVITYNYDNLLELGLGQHLTKPIWKASQRPKRDQLPIYHVHGYVPIQGRGSKVKELVFTEDQYYLAAQNAYSWGNLIQIEYLSNTVGLMIGLSLTDRNMRRLLDALKKTPLPPECYVILQRPRWAKAESHDLNRINLQAKKYFDEFSHSGLKTGNKEGEQINEIISGVEAADLDMEERLLKELGVRPIWYQEHAEVPQIINQIMSP